MSVTAQNLLPRIASKPALRAGWVRVRDNHGCAGVDGVSIKEFELSLDDNLSSLATELTQQSYCPMPLMRIFIDKGNGERRALSIPTVRDRVAQAAALNVLAPIFETQFENCSFAYRKGRSVRQAILKVREYYDQGYRWVLDADIDAFFDNVPHDRLLDKVNHLIADGKVQNLIRLWVEAEVWDGENVSRLKLGIPQGSVVSPMLANLYLDELDEELLARGQRLVRYADDFLVLSKNQSKAQEAAHLTEAVLRRMELELDEADIVHFDRGFSFLGAIFCRSSILIPFDRDKKPKRTVYVPPPLDIEVYLRGRSV